MPNDVKLRTDDDEHFIFATIQEAHDALEPGLLKDKLMRSWLLMMRKPAIPSTVSGETVPVAWRYRYKTDRTGDAWDEWMVVTVDPNDWDWAPAWHDFECQPLYASPAETQR